MLTTNFVSQKAISLLLRLLVLVLHFQFVLCGSTTPIWTRIFHFSTFCAVFFSLFFSKRKLSLCNNIFMLLSLSLSPFNVGNSVSPRPQPQCEWVGRLIWNAETTSHRHIETREKFFHQNKRKLFGNAKKIFISTYKTERMYIWSSSGAIWCLRFRIQD